MSAGLNPTKVWPRWNFFPAFTGSSRSKKKRGHRPGERANDIPEEPPPTATLTHSWSYEAVLRYPSCGTPKLWFSIRPLLILPLCMCAWVRLTCFVPRRWDDWRRNSVYVLHKINDMSSNLFLEYFIAMGEIWYCRLSNCCKHVSM